MKTRSTIAAIVAAVFAMMMFAAPATAGGHHYPPPTECVPEHTVHHDAIPETTHIVHHDAVPETFTDTPAIWLNFSPNNYEGTFDGPPSYPTDERGTWHDHGQLPPGQAGPDGVYQNGNGNGSWFYRHAGTHIGNGDGVDAYDEVVGNGDGVDAWDEVIPQTGDCGEECPDDTQSFGSTYPPIECPEPIEVTPSVEINDVCGTDNDSFVFGDEAGLTYASEPNEDGTYTVTPDEGYTIVIEDSNGLFSIDTETGLATFHPEGIFTDEPCVGTPTGIPFSVTPEPASCDAAGSFDAASLGGEYNEENGRWEFDNVNVEVLFNNPSEGDVTINVFAHEGFVIDPTLVSDEWFVEAGGARASQTITLEERLTVNPETGQPCQLAVVTLSPPVITDLCGVDNDVINLPANTDGVSYRWADETDPTNFDVEAILDAGATLAEIPDGWVEIDTNAYRYAVVDPFTDVPCTTTTPPPPTTPVTPVSNPVPPTQATLASTGSNDVAPLIGLAALLALLGTGGVVAAARNRK